MLKLNVPNYMEKQTLEIVVDFQGQEDNRYAIVMTGLPQFGGKPVPIELCWSLSNLKESYSRSFDASKNKKNIIPVEIPKHRTYKDVLCGELIVLEDILEN